MTISEPLILDLSKISFTAQNQIGGKAANLTKLIENNLNVPKGYVLTTSAYQSFLKENRLEDFIDRSLSDLDDIELALLEEKSKNIQKIIKKGHLPKPLKKRIEIEHDRLNLKRVVVRSSAIAEDMPNASFAGQYESFLNIKSLEDVFHYIKCCYSSLWTSRAIAYRQKNKVSHFKMKIAVIVQKMILAKCAGVLFTRNPVSMKNSELLIESNYGLGESIMSGSTSPDSFLLKKQTRKKNTNYEIIDRRIGNKEKVVIPNENEDKSGVEYITLYNNETCRASLNDKEIIKLAELGSTIEKTFGSPQDIEWAIDKKNHIYLLQTRPITALKSKEQDQIIWSRGYSDDYWSDNTTPLFFDLLGDHLTNVVNIELNNIMGYKLVDHQLLKLFNAHVYFNLKVLKRKVEYEIPKFMRNEDLLNYFPEGSGKFGKKKIKNLPFHLIPRIVAELRVSIYDPNGSITKTASTYEKWNNEAFKPYCKKFDKKLEKFKNEGSKIDLFNLARELDEVMISHFRLVRYGIPVHNIGMNLLLQYLLNRFLGKKAQLRYFPILISDINHKLTETNDNIHELASMIQNNEKLKKLVMQKRSDKIFKLLQNEENPLYRGFLRNFNKFLKNYGHRGFTREPYYPRWGEAPKYIFDILKSLVSEQEQDLKEIKRRNTQKKNLTEKLVETKIRKQFLGFIKWKVFSIILKFARKYIKFRELQRFNLDQWITRLRETYLEIGDRLSKEGLLKNKENIFFLKKKELKGIILKEEGIADLNKLLEKRKKIFKKYEHIIPPKFLNGNREFDDYVVNELERNIFKGIPASQGVAKGIIRVLHKIDQIPNVRSGDILVVSKTDPGWTPCFSKIGGLITETGGVLSHGAVVSREYGIPAITNISNACQIFKTGQVIKMNGYNGIVQVKKP